MKKIFTIFVCVLALSVNVFSQEIELRMVSIDTTPIADVTKVKNIEMLEHEVTLALYNSVMREQPEKVSNNLASDMLGSLAKNLKSKKKTYYQELGVHDNHPVVAISFYDAIYFCNKLSKIYGLTPVYAVDGENDETQWDYNIHSGEFIKGKITQSIQANGYRLPTEIEWVFAAKGNQDYFYPGSDNIDEVAWYSKNSKRKTNEIAQKKANGFGLYDMLGNVEEWTFKTRLDKSIVSENEQAAQNLGKKNADGSVITYVNIRDPLATIVHGKNFKTLALGCKDMWYDLNRKTCSCNEQSEERGFRIVRTITE